MKTYILFFGLVVGLAAQQQGRLTLEDLLSPEPVGETALSPDGSTFALTRNAQIVLLPAAGGWPVTLTSTSGAKTGLSWSPDGRSLAYASQGSIWSVAVAGGAPRRLTRTPPGEGDPRTAGDREPQWSPKGKWILYESGRSGRDSLNLVSADGAANNVLVESNSDTEAATWAPDGSAVSYVERAPQYFSGKLEVVKFDAARGAAAGDPVTLYAAPTDQGGGWSLRKAAWSPDGRRLAVVLQESGWDHVYLLAASGGQPKQLTQGEFEDTTPVFSPDGKSLAVASSRGNLEANSIWIVPTDGSAAHALWKGGTRGVESGAEWSRDGKKVYFHRQSPLESADLLVSDATGSGDAISLTQTTPKNLAAALRMPDRITYKSKDGREIRAMLYKPRDFVAGTRYPAVLWIHGGPEGQDNFRLDVWAQYLAQAGYVVLEPNYRGSSGYGEKFRNLNVEDSGGGEMDDVAAGAQYLVSQSEADAKRLAIGGGSHGGTMVGYAVTKYPDLFAAAIELYGVVDRATFLERTNRPSAVRWAMKMGGTPAEKPEVYRKADSLVDVAKIKTPLLVMHGENDPQVPPYESVQFTRALKQEGKTFYYFTYPGELHGFAQREHRLDAWKKQLAFLQKYVAPKYGLSSSGTEDLLVK